MRLKQLCHRCSAPIPYGIEHVAVSYLRQVTDDGQHFDVCEATDCVHWCLECAPPAGEARKALVCMRENEVRR